MRIILETKRLSLHSFQILHDFAFYVIFSDLPKYMNDVLHISIKDNGLYSSIPHASRNIFTFFCGFLCAWLISTDRLSITNVRKLFFLIASIFSGVFLIVASYAGCNEFLVVLSFAISVGALGAMLVSGCVNPMDLSPNYAGALTGLINGSGAISGILAPYVVGLMTPNVSQWNVPSAKRRLIRKISFSLCSLSGEWSSG